ncbi:hypothetical protein ABW19_dt0207713 [Dactylella cylindrospora]|nr:hypothetical protein ABW19_dt0207713 [Dactylella cylindrospora]
MGSSPALDKPPIVKSLNARRIFETLTPKEKLYAHHLSRASWQGARIIMAQVSKESESIYDLILELYAISNGDWKGYGEKIGVAEDDITKFLEYAATFLHNMGNYFGKGDQRFNPQIPESEFGKLASGSEKAQKLYNSVSELIYAPTPASLGYPSKSGKAQSTYYLVEEGSEDFTKDEISGISKVLQDLGTNQENTRFLKKKVDDTYEYVVYQASTEESAEPKVLQVLDSGDLSGRNVRLATGDHKEQLTKINESLTAALEFTATEKQTLTLEKLIESFRTGDMETYKESQRHWVKDIQPAIENIFGFVEPYRDPAGVRAEYEGLVGLVDKEETKALTRLAEDSARFIRLLPWAKDCVDNDGKGPFEKELFEAPDFTSLHSDAYLLLKYHLPRHKPAKFQRYPPRNRLQKCHNRKLYGRPRRPKASTTSTTAALPSRYSETIQIDPSARKTFSRHYDSTFYLWVVFHELLGHGTGKLLTENADGTFNFDKENPPVNPVDGKPISSWYKPGETWTGLFGDIATTVDECRCEVVGAYLIGFPEILAMFGYEDEKVCEEMEYNMYLQLGCDGLRALNNYIPDSEGHFGIMRILLNAGDNFLTIKEDSTAKTLTVSVDRSKIKSHGSPALSDFLLKLHMFRSTADVKGCREYYEELTTPDETFLRWREMIVANKPPQELFVQDNTFLKDGEVVLKEYPATLEGMIESWVDRNV